MQILFLAQDQILFCYGEVLKHMLEIQNPLKC